MSLCNFTNTPEHVQFRVSGTLTLVLTSVAYKLMLSNTLPTISYLTLVVSLLQQNIFAEKLMTLCNTLFFAIIFGANFVDLFRQQNSKNQLLRHYSLSCAKINVVTFSIVIYPG